jgi:hypothetical protein
MTLMTPVCGSIVQVLSTHFLPTSDVLPLTPNKQS